MYIAWTPEQEKLLLKYYPSKKTDIPELLEVFTKQKIQYKARRLGLSKKEMRWTEEMIKTLKIEYPIYGSKCPSFKGLTRGQITSTAHRYGLTCKQTKSHYTLKDGTIAKVLVRIDYKHVLAEFPNGKTYECELHHLKRGCIPREYANDLMLKYEGTAKNGLRFKVDSEAGYKGKEKQYKIIFEDGESKITIKNSILAGRIGHPFLSTSKSCEYKGFKTVKIRNIPFYNCECLTCGHKDVMSPQDMIKGCPNCKN